MSERSVGCEACGADVPAGRLSCPACGELVASVSSGLIPTPEPPTAGTPGAYVPPATLLPSVIGPGRSPLAAATAMGGAGGGATLQAPARVWAATPVEAPRPASTPMDLPTDDDSDGEASLLADPVVRARADEVIGWIAVAGCALGGIGFLAPWARTMIGSGGDGYIDRWGLAGPGHVLLFLAFAAIGALAVVPNRVPAWLRLGIPGLAVGSLVVGLAWAYLLGPLGPQVGVYLSVAGALVLVGAAVTCLVVDRHGRTAPGV